MPILRGVEGASMLSESLHFLFGIPGAFNKPQPPSNPRIRQWGKACWCWRRPCQFQASGVPEVTFLRSHELRTSAFEII